MSWVWRGAVAVCFVVYLITGCVYDPESIESKDISSGLNSLSESMELTQEDMTKEVCNKMWQDAYAELLQDFFGGEFYLCDIDCNGIPELLIGGPSADMGKYAEYDVYTYRNNIVICLGTVEALTWGSLWLDDNCGILSYSYGAGGGGTYRYYIDNDVLCYDGEMDGYYYDREEELIEWFKGADGSKIFVTEETKYEYERIWKSRTVLERYTINDDMVLKVIYGENVS